MSFTPLRSTFPPHIEPLRIEEIGYTSLYVRENLLVLGPLFSTKWILDDAHRFEMELSTGYVRTAKGGH